MIKLIKAFVISFKGHRGQKDKAGKPYILHPLKVSLKVDTIDEKVVALLHDILEDTHYTLKDLKFLSDKQKDALVLLTKDKKTSYMDYIKAIKKNPIARKLKINDLKHNMDLTRLKNINDKDIKRRNKYKQAIKLLKEQ